MIIRNRLRSFGTSSGRFAAWIILVFLVIAFINIIAVQTFSVWAILGVLFLTACCLFVVTAYDGTEINLQDRTFRNVTCCLGMVFGTSKSLPTIVKVSVLESTDSVYAADAYNNSISGVKMVYVVRLHPKDSKTLIIAGKHDKQEKAKSEGEKFAQNFQVELVMQSKMQR